MSHCYFELHVNMLIQNSSGYFSRWILFLTLSDFQCPKDIGNRMCFYILRTSALSRRNSAFG